MASDNTSWSSARNAAREFLRRFGDAWTVREREDLAQDSLLLAWQWGDARAQQRTLDAAVRTIARRVRSRGLRRCRQRATVQIEQGHRLELHEVGPPPQARLFVVAGRRVGAEWLRARLEQEIARLRTLDRCLLLASNEGFCNAELACRFDLSPAVVKVRLHRTRRRLKRGIEAAVRAADGLDLC